MTFERIRKVTVEGRAWYVLLDVARWLRITMPEAMVILKAAGTIPVRVMRIEDEQGRGGYRKQYITAEGIAQFVAKFYILPISTDGQATGATRYTRKDIGFLIKRAKGIPKLYERLTQLMSVAELTEVERTVLDLRAKGFNSAGIGMKMYYTGRNIQRIQARAIEKIMAAQDQTEVHQVPN